MWERYYYAVAMLPSLAGDSRTRFLLQHVVDEAEYSRLPVPRNDSSCLKRIRVLANSGTNVTGKLVLDKAPNRLVITRASQSPEARSAEKHHIDEVLAEEHCRPSQHFPQEALERSSVPPLCLCLARASIITSSMPLPGYREASFSANKSCHEGVDVSAPRLPCQAFD